MRGSAVDRLLARAFAATVRMYPRTLRRNAEAEMTRAFRDGLAARSGGSARLSWAGREVADAVAGLAPAWLDARRSTKRNPTMRATSIFDGLGHDVRSAVRALVRRPGFAVFVALTIALGIGANSAVFSVLHSVLVAPLPYEEAGQLVRLYRVEDGADRGDLSEPAFADFRENLSSIRITALDNYGGREYGADVSLDGRAERVHLLPVSADYFDVLGADVILGRPFARDDERGDAPVVVISEGLWQRALQSDPNAVGRSLVLDGVSRRVSGVVSSAFVDPVVGAIDVWVPQRVEPRPSQWDNYYLTVYGRLAPGASLASARAEVEGRSGVQRRIAEGRLEGDYRGTVVPLQDDLVRSSEPMLLVLMGAVGILLLITCANVTALVLARSVGRGPELSIRAALGSGRGRLIRQLVIESLLLAVIGAGAGLLAGALVQRALVAAAPAALPASTTVGYGWPVALFAAGLALLVGLLVGGLPAFQVTRRALERNVRSGVRAGEPAGHQRMRKTLVAAEVALAVVLLVGAGLLLSSFQRLRTRDLGVEARNVWTFQVNLPNARYADPEDRVRFHAALHERVRAIPGVERVGAASRLPATGRYHGPWAIRQRLDDATIEDAQNRTIQGEWFAALGIPLLEGRQFGPEDTPDAPRRAVLSSSLADRLFPGESAIGRQFLVLGQPLEVIGVVGDVAKEPTGPPALVVYHAHEQFAYNRNWALFQVVETAGPVPGLVDIVRAQLAELDPNLVLIEPEPLSAVLGRQTAGNTFVTLLVSVFAGLAIALAALGIYGILSYYVRRSRHEIGIRMALGAGAWDVRRLVAWRGMSVTAIGAVAGTLGALALSRVLGSLLFEVSPYDARVVGVAVGLVLVIGAAASWLPARRATSVEPAEAFRET
ncbi:MAG: ADOP family duplicated permease [Gemmatimonadota bacterium]|nr:ADOP family duplicated permease [Gemmatimonadota bacterium]